MPHIAFKVIALLLGFASHIAFAETLKVVPVDALYHYRLPDGQTTDQQPEGGDWWHVPNGDAFINLSEWGTLGPIQLKPSKGYPKYPGDDDKHHLSLKKSQAILKQLGISLNDQLFIYDIYQDKVITLTLKDLLPLMVYIDPYSTGQDDINTENFVFGLQLKKGTIPEEFGEFAYIGNINPFVEGQIEEIIWTPISEEQFPVDTFTNHIDIEHIEEKNSYQFQGKEFTFSIHSMIYSQTHGKRKAYRFADYLEANDKEGKVVFEMFRGEGESSHPSPLYERNSEYPKDNRQWTGRLFKDHEPIFYNNRTYRSFGCESIPFVSRSKKSIPILCDNRH